MIFFSAHSVIDSEKVDGYIKAIMGAGGGGGLVGWVWLLVLMLDHPTNLVTPAPIKRRTILSKRMENSKMEE